MNSVAADLRDLFAGEIAKNKRLVIELERIQAQAVQLKQESADWKLKADKFSYDADLVKRENNALQREIERLNRVITKERSEKADLQSQLNDVKQQWKSENQSNEQKIEDLRCLTEAFAKTIKDLEAKLAIAERPPTQLINAVNSVRAAAEDEIKTRLSAQETYYEKRLQLVDAELEDYRKQYAEMREIARNAELGVNRSDLPNTDTTKDTAKGAEDLVTKRTDEQSRTVIERPSSKLSTVPDDEDTLYLLSPRPGSSLTFVSEASTDMRKQLQHRITRPRSHKVQKHDSVLDVATSLVARPMSAPIKKFDKSSITGSSSSVSNSVKVPTYIGAGTDFYDSIFGGRKQVKFGVSTDPNKVKDENDADSSASTAVLTISGPVRISAVHPHGIYIRLRNTADVTEEIGGHHLMQLVDGKQAATYKFVPNACIPARGFTTIWAGSRFSEDEVRKLCSDHRNVVWKELQEWGAGPQCTTVFAKPTGEALCWVNGALLDETVGDKDMLANLNLNLNLNPNPNLHQIEETYQGSLLQRSQEVAEEGEGEQEVIGSQETRLPSDLTVDVIRKRPNSALPRKRSKSPYGLLHSSEDQVTPASLHRPGKVRVDEFDMTSRLLANGSTADDRSKAAVELSVGDTKSLVRPGSTMSASPRKLVAQGLQVLKAQHNLRFQPPMFNSRHPIAPS